MLIIASVLLKSPLVLEHLTVLLFPMEVVACSLQCGCDRLGKKSSSCSIGVNDFKVANCRLETRGQLLPTTQLAVSQRCHEDLTRSETKLFS